LKLDIKNNEEKSWEGREFDLAPDTRLSFRALRYSPSANNEFLALHFKFENRNQDPMTTSSSLFLLKLEAENRVRIVKENFYYPQQNKLELRDWIQQGSNTSKENALRDIDLEY
jgi:hypothetical protein